jgi:hypothetical protein
MTPTISSLIASNILHSDLIQSDKNADIVLFFSPLFLSTHSNAKKEWGLDAVDLAYAKKQHKE